MDVDDRKDPKGLETLNRAQNPQIRVFTLRNYVLCNFEYALRTSIKSHPTLSMYSLVYAPRTTILPLYNFKQP